MSVDEFTALHGLVLKKAGAAADVAAVLGATTDEVSTALEAAVAEKHATTGRGKYMVTATGRAWLDQQYRTAFARLMVRCAVGLRIGSAVAAGIAAFVGLAPPASVAAVATAVTVTTVWSAAYAVLLLRRRGGGWPVAADAGVAALLGLAVGRLVPAAVLADTTGWVFLYASTTVIISPLVARTLVAAAVSVANRCGNVPTVPPVRRWLRRGPRSLRYPAAGRRQRPTPRAASPTWRLRSAR